MKKFFFDIYGFLVCALCDDDSDVLKALVAKGKIHQNPYNKSWFFGPAPDYEKMARENRQVRQWDYL